MGRPVLRDRVNLGIALDMAKDGVANRGLAELPRHGDMLCMVQILAAKENHLPLQEGVTHGFERFRRQWPAEVDPTDFSADVQGQGNNFD
jgi:hypothetical protein